MSVSYSCSGCGASLSAFAKTCYSCGATIVAKSPHPSLSGVKRIWGAVFGLTVAVEMVAIFLATNTGANETLEVVAISAAWAFGLTFGSFLAAVPLLFNFPLIIAAQLIFEKILGIDLQEVSGHQDPPIIVATHVLVMPLLAIAVVFSCRTLVLEVQPPEAIACEGPTEIVVDGQCTDDCSGVACGPSPTIGADCGMCPLEWVSISGGSFIMGGSDYTLHARPIHEVTVLDFEVARTEVTVNQFRACIQAGACESMPNDSTGFSGCNWDEEGRDLHPMNCLNFQDAVQFCEWVGGRLPTEAEWEYAARSQGQERSFPWGDEEPTCELANRMCPARQTTDVCDKPAGNTEQGLCDMAGNIAEWALDYYHPSYDGAPTDGSARQDQLGDQRVVRGGYFTGTASSLNVAAREGRFPQRRDHMLGVRCARAPVAP